jgi:hypothetical protein
MRLTAVIRCSVPSERSSEIACYLNQGVVLSLARKCHRMLRSVGDGTSIGETDVARRAFGRCARQGSHTGRVACIRHLALLRRSEHTPGQWGNRWPLRSSLIDGLSLDIDPHPDRPTNLPTARTEVCCRSQCHRARRLIVSTSRARNCFRLTALSRAKCADGTWRRQTEPCCRHRSKCFAFARAVSGLATKMAHPTRFERVTLPSEGKRQPTLLSTADGN